MATTTPPPPAPGTTHSPGPWRVHGQSESGRYITVKAANGRTVARVPFNPENTPLSECTDASDAHLIAAAPVLLAALLLCQKRLLQNVSHPEFDPGTTHPWLDAARVAIAKARGQ